MSQGFVVPFGTGDKFDFGGFGVDWKIDGDLTERRFSVVHHPLTPRTLAGPLHRHHREPHAMSGEQRHRASSSRYKSQAITANTMALTTTISTTTSNALY
jgi:hypothetical protein